MHMVNLRKWRLWLGENHGWVFCDSDNLIKHDPNPIGSIENQLF
jgi:hypothetical protein